MIVRGIKVVFFPPCIFYPFCIFGIFLFQTLIIEEGFLRDLNHILRQALLWDAHCHAAGTVRNLAAGSQADVSKSYCNISSPELKFGYVSECGYILEFGYGGVYTCTSGSFGNIWYNRLLCQSFLT